jgi:hypothetical protein
MLASASRRQLPFRLVLLRFRGPGPNVGTVLTQAVQTKRGFIDPADRNQVATVIVRAVDKDAANAGSGYLREVIFC